MHTLLLKYNKESCLSCPFCLGLVNLVMTQQLAMIFVTNVPVGSWVYALEVSARPTRYLAMRVSHGGSYVDVLFDSTPYMIYETPAAAGVDSSTAFTCWKKYPAFGVPHGFVTKEGMLQHPVPSCAIMAEGLLAQLQDGAPPAPLLEGKTNDACYCCGKHSDQMDGAQLMACVRCKLARYCSKECQKADFKEHKAFCKQWAKAS